MSDARSHWVRAIAACLAVCMVEASYAASVIGFSEEVVVTSEDALYVCVSLTRTAATETTTSVVVDCVVTGGTATAGEDFGVGNTSVFFPVGATSAEFCVGISTDCVLEGAPSDEGPFETIELQLRNPTEGALLGRDRTVVKIFDRPGIIISFSSDSTAVNEDAKLLSVDVHLSRVCPGEVTVAYYTTNRTASAGRDYEPRMGSFIFANGETSKTITVPILDNFRAEGDRILGIVLTNLIGASFARKNELLVAIHDDEHPVVQDATFDISKPHDGEIEAMVRQPDGKLLIAGSFFSVDGFPSRSVARLNPDGSVDRAFHPHLTGGINGVVHALQSLPDGSVVIAGPFDLVQGYEFPGVARFRSDGVVDLEFDPYGVPGVTVMLLQPDGKLLMAGGSSFIGPQLGRYLPDGSPEQTFRIGPPGVSLGQAFWTLGIQADGKILAGGEFSQIDSIPRSGLVRFSTSGSVDTSFSVALASPNSGRVIVRSLIVQPDDKIVIAGKFEKVNGVDRPGLARLNADGSLDTSFEPPGGTAVDFSNVRSLVLAPDGGIFWVGVGSPLAPNRRSGVVRIDSGGNLDPQFNPAFDSLTRLSFANNAVIQPDGRILVAGSGIQRLFGSSAGLRGLGFSVAMTNYVEEGSSLEVIVERLGNLDLEPLTAVLETRNGTAVAGQDFVAVSTNVTLAPGTRTATVSVPIIRDGKAELEETFELALTSPGPGLYVGGQPRFTVIIPDKDPPSIVDVSFQPERVSAGPVAVQADGKVLITETGDAYRVNKVWRLNQDGSIDPTFQQTVISNWIARIVPYPDGKLLVATISQPFAGYGLGLLRLNADGTLDIGFTPSFDIVQLREIVVRPDGKVLVATDSGVRLLTADGSIEPLKSDRLGIPSAFAMQTDGKFLVHLSSPLFDSPLSVQRHLPDGTFDQSFNAPVRYSWRQTGSGRITAIAAVPDGAVFMAGDFNNIYGIRLLGLAKLHPDGVLDLDFSANEALYFQDGLYPIRLDPQIISLSVQPDGKVLVLLNRYDFIGLPIGGPLLADSLIRLNPGGSLDRDFRVSQILGAFTTISAMAVQPDGNILLRVSSSESGADHNPRLIRIFGLSHSVSRIGFTANQFFVGEPTGQPAITLRREGDIGSSASVNVTLSGETATEGEDFAPFAATLQFAPFETEKSVLLPVQDDPFAETDERLLATLTSPVNTAVNLDRVPVVIADNDRPGSLDFSFAVGLGDPTPNENVTATGMGLLENGLVVVETLRYSALSQLPRYGVEVVRPDGAVLATFPEDNSTYAAVDFATVSGQDVYVWGYHGEKRDLVQLRSDGTVSRVIPVDLAFFVNDLFVLPLVDGSILVYGNFVRSKDGQTRAIERLLPDGSWDDTFKATLPNYEGIQTAMLDKDGHVLLGGHFTLVNGSTNFGIARINFDGTLDESFNVQPGVLSRGGRGAVYTIGLQSDGKIILGGSFDACNGVTRRNLARLNQDGSLDPAYDPGSALVQPGEELLAVRQVSIEDNGKAVILYDTFHAASESFSPRLARLNADGTVDLTFDLRFDGQIFQFAVQDDGKVLVGGNFRTINGIARPGLARLNGDTPLRIHTLMLDSTGAPSIAVAASTGKQYILDRSVDLNAWLPVSTNLADSARLELKDDTQMDAVQRFYRVRQVP